ncbi:flagellar hook-basal body complex protein FliE [Helicobacter anatolicus]|uniref:flagellar hook-basal body complex protein FliE n=1 Tax=Helicobacter anatolicus TaxID=2905874 RepID=UPI001E469019|nr:flagellar hook-basal body complex protein FliE [Helicobacter anatolicus]MCE3040242.1 flagellar hook-basal body complex protein FliE [Helicobacter anatolicus]
MEKLDAKNFLKIDSIEQNKNISSTSNATKINSGDFSKLLKKSIDELNQAQESSDKALVDMATGQVKDLHQAAIAIGKAETSMKLMLEVRNKAISAYKEILRTQI